MADTRKLSIDASTKALGLRLTLGLGIAGPLCVYDVAESLGIEVRFLDIPSLEGMYIRSTRPIIILSSLRPPGRQVSTCAHELGHHIFGHGTHIDEIVGGPATRTGFQPEEFLADSFAALLLMPKAAVSHAFAVRSWDVKVPTCSQVYAIAGWFGVGYTSVINHMERTLRMLTSGHAAILRECQPMRIRAAILGVDSPTSHLVVVDSHWTSRPVDLAVGDCALVPTDTYVEGACVAVEKTIDAGTVLRAVTPGRGRLHQPTSGWATYVRVSREGYVGRSLFRHLEDSDCE